MLHVKRLTFCIALALLIFIAHHATVYLHEWTHGTIAWLAGYKKSPFGIHYGVQWITLLDIDEAVPYPAILADGKPSVMTAIAIRPILL